VELRVTGYQLGDFTASVWSKPTDDPFRFDDHGIMSEPDQGACTIIGTAQDDVLRGTTGDDDTICGLGGQDRIYGRAGDDLLLGDAGNDRLYGGLGNDGMIGGAGIDYCKQGQGHGTFFARTDCEHNI